MTVYIMCSVHTQTFESGCATEEDLVSAGHGNFIMPVIMLRMNNAKLWRYIGLYWGDRNRCDRCSSDFPPEHSRFMAYEACIHQDM
jgi:hypothetical protein